MKKFEKIIISAMTAFVTITATSATLAESTEITNPNEKCYGIVKAGMNDCAIPPTASCAGSATKDKQPNAFIFLPKGLCDKIVGGSLKSKG